MEIKDNIGKRIRDIRLSKGLTQAELGGLLGLSDKSVSSYEKGNSDLSTFVAAKIAEIGGRSIDWLITGKEKPSNTPQPTKEDALRLVLTSDPALVEKIKDDLRHQIREETPNYQSRLSSNETRLLKAFALLDDRRQERLIDTAEDMSVALLRGSDQEGTGRGRNCAGSNET